MFLNFFVILLTENLIGVFKVHEVFSHTVLRLLAQGWNFYVQPSEYGEWLRELELRLAERIAQKREWRTTFTEMALLLSSRDIQKGARTALRLLAEVRSVKLHCTYEKWYQCEGMFQCALVRLLNYVSS